MASFQDSMYGARFKTPYMYVSPSSEEKLEDIICHLSDLKL